MKFTKFKSFLFQKKVWIPAFLILLVLVWIFMDGGSAPQIENVVRKDVVEEVVATGKTKSDSSVELGFDRTGRVSNVYAKIGDNVIEGQIIAEIESGEVRASLLKAKASLNEELVSLNKLKKESPIELSDAEVKTISSIKEAFSVADGAVRNKADQFFKTPSSKPNFEVKFTDGNFVHYFTVPSDTAIDLNNRRAEVENVLLKWKIEMDALSPEGAKDYSSKALVYMNTVSTFFDKLSLAINSFTASSFNYESTVSGYKSDVSSARASISSAVSTIITARATLNQAPGLQGGELSSVLVQESKVDSARANVTSLEAQLQKYIIRAPFSGVVSKQDAKVGEVAQAGVPVISIISENNMYVEANISEINIGKVAVANPVRVEFDALPGESFSGRLSYIEPAETIVDNVVNYKVRVELVVKDIRIKSGMTTSLYIETRRSSNTLSIPGFSVKEDEVGFYVDKLENSKVNKVYIKKGIIGSDGAVEVLNGLAEGDKVQY